MVIHVVLSCYRGGFGYATLTLVHNMKYDWEIVEKIVDKLIQNREIREKDSEVAKFCVVCMLYGKNKAKVKELADCNDFDRYWLNLKKGGYFYKLRKTLRIETKELMLCDMPFLWMINVARGLLERRQRGSNFEYRRTEKGEDVLKEEEREPVGVELLGMGRLRLRGEK